jgi:hypothetical protein
MITNKIVESITPAKWCLVGSVTAPEHLLQTSRSLKVVRRFGVLSSQIMSAMNRQSILPVVEINTGDGKITLVNAKIVNIVPHVPHTTPERSTPPSGFVAGVYAATDNTVTKRRNPYEQEEVWFAFQMIDFRSIGGGKKLHDDWSAPV